MEENERDKGLSGDMTPDKDVDDDDDDKEEGLTSDDTLLRGEGGEETKTGISDVPIDTVNPVEPCVSRLDFKCVVEGVDGDVESAAGGCNLDGPFHGLIFFFPDLFTKLTFRVAQLLQYISTALLRLRCAPTSSTLWPASQFSPRSPRAPTLAFSPRSTTRPPS